MTWKEVDNQLVKEFKQSNFTEIVQQLNKLDIICTRLDHHPDFEVYGYNKIIFKLSTHTVGKVTEKDHTLAREIDALFG